MGWPLASRCLSGVGLRAMIDSVRADGLASYRPFALPRSWNDS